jgi:putative ABC transport system permease protein
MFVWVPLRLAWRSLGRHKMRSILTMLGIIIGVAAVIATLAIGMGARASVQERIASLGSNVIMIFNGSTTSSGARVWGSGNSLTEQDAEAIRNECSAVDLVSVTARTAGQIISTEANWGTTIQGISEDYFYIRGWEIESGSAFTDADVRGAAKVCVLGASTADQLFPGGGNPVGEMIRIKGLPFRVMGVLKRKGGSLGGHRDQDDVVMAPVTTVQRKLSATSRRRVGAIMVSAVSADRVNQAMQQIKELLRQRHRLRPGDDDDFIIRSQSEFADAAEETTSTMTILLASIAAVSLLVGGIGIMNIMLVSVTERTREIGIRMAVGARPRDIQRQFLVESAFLSFLGGLIGIVLGIAASNVITSVARWPTIVRPESVIIAFIFSAAVGIFFGFYPALKAARLDPIEALRYE